MHLVERGDGTPLVLLHGFGVDHRILLPLDDAIAEAGPWRRIYMDLPGHGLTPAGHVASAEDMAKEVERQIDEVTGGVRFAVLGNSFGGMIARRVAHDLEERVLGLATLAGVFVAESSERDLPDRALLLENEDVIEGMGDAGDDFADMAVIQTSEHAQAFLDHVLPGLEVSDRRAMARIARRYGFSREPEDVATGPFTKPALFLTGRQDHVVGFRDAWARHEHYTRATYATLDSAGHNVHLERSALARALVQDWLARMGPAAGAS